MMFCHVTLSAATWLLPDSTFLSLHLCLNFSPSSIFPGHWLKQLYQPIKATYIHSIQKDIHRPSILWWEFWCGQYSGDLHSFSVFFTGFLLIATLILRYPFLLAPSLFERTSSLLPWASISLTFGNPSPKFLLLYITRPSCRTSTQRLALAWGRHLWIQSGGS